MEYLLTGKAAKEVDSYCINKIGIPSVVLMERAAVEVAGVTDKAVSENLQYADTDIIILCGTGNNGADGVAAARILSEMGHLCRVCVIGNIEKATEEFNTQYNIINNMGIPVEICDSSSKTEEYINGLKHLKRINIVIIDAIFGIGLSRDVKGMYLEMIKGINELEAMVVSVDIASGLDSATGRVMGAAIKADITVTFGKAKSGQFLCEGREYSGKIIVGDAGFVNGAYNNVRCSIPDEISEYLTREDFKLLPARKKTSNKGTYKNVNIIGAGADMSGASALSGMAAYACGTGIVKIYAGDNNTDAIKTLLKEAVVSNYSGFIAQDKSPEKDIIIAGPGLSTTDEALHLLEDALKTKCKIVIDADALNLISMNKILLQSFHENIVITPHIKEMSRLTGETSQYIRENIVSCARKFSEKYGCTTVIKDASTVICSPKGKIRINTTGNSGMSKGGSGDVLSGIIGGLISQNMSVFDAACLGVYMHGMAGDLAVENKSEYSILATDIVNALPEVIKLGRA